MNFKISLFFILNVFLSMGYSLVAPLFPVLGEKLTLSEHILGLIISAYSMTNFIITPFVPQLVSIIGRKKLFYISNIIEALATIIYGLMIYVNNYYIFIFITFSVRLIHGIGGGIAATLLYSLGASLSSPEEIVTNLGYLEIAWSLGISLGPVLASCLYHFGGFSLPFFTIGGLFFIVIYFIRILDISDKGNEENINFLKFLNFEMLTNLIPTIIFQIAQTYYFPSLTYHLTRKWGLSIEASSLFFMIGMTTYLIILQVLKKIIQNLGLILTILLGQIVIIFGPPFVYPLKFLPQSLFCIIFGLALLGTSGAFTCVAVIIKYGNIAKSEDNSLDESSANDIASAVFNLGINLGDFFGPIYGGFMSTHFGFKYSNIFMSVIAFINCIYYYIYYRKEMNSIFIDISTNGFCKNWNISEDEKKLERLDIKAPFNHKASSVVKFFEDHEKDEELLLLNENDS